MNLLECEYCLGIIQPKKVTVEHWHEGTLVIITDVPVDVCGKCRERYYEAATLEQLDAIARESESAQGRMSVPILTFAFS
jgi:YgiT-type zinc finger domain-containing protein